MHKIHSLVSGMASEVFCAGEDEVARQMFDLFLERILTSLEPVYLAEQQFCILFLDLTARGGLKTEVGEALSVLDRSAMSSGSRTPSKSTSVDELDSVSRTSSEEILSKLKKRDRDIGQEVRDRSLTLQDLLPQLSFDCRRYLKQALWPAGMTSFRIFYQNVFQVRHVMAKLFGSLEEELNKFVAAYDGVYSMYLLVRLCHHTIKTQDAGSYLCKLYGMALVISIYFSPASLSLFAKYLKGSFKGN